VHLIGKEILWFHAVIWPALLMALGLPLPGRVYAHSFWISEGKKMSKTLGNFIDLPTLRAYETRFSLDALRWYLLTQGPLHETDADFSYAKFVEVYNADLANSVSNSINRVGNMIEKYFGGTVPDHGGKFAWTGAELMKLKPAEIPAGPWQEHGFDWPARCRAAVEAATAAVDRFDLETALRAGRALVSDVDSFISVTAPFKLAKLVETDAGAKATLAGILYCCAETLRVATLLLHPAMPAKTAEAWASWNCSPLKDPADPKAGFAAPLSALGAFAGPHGLRPGAPIAKGDPLFMRAKAEDPAPTP
jgi:methionyl-tRNA synthetase